MNEDRFVDYLTGLDSRQMLTADFQRLLGKPAVLFFFDLDNFKTINDLYGHVRGDDVLKRFAAVLRDCFPEGGTYRLGGDEFAALLSGPIAKEELNRKVSAVYEGTRKRENLPGNEDLFPFLSVSIGVAFHQDPDEQLTEFLSRADAAMYESKTKGKNCCTFYSEIEDRVRLEEEMVAAFPDAMEKDRIRLLFSPIVNLQNSTLVGTKVHFLWENASGTVWKEKEFSPVLENRGLSETLDLFLLEKLCRERSRKNPDVCVPGKLHVPVSGLSLADDVFAKRVGRVLRQYGQNLSFFEFVIREDQLRETRTVGPILKGIRHLKDSGFSLGLSGFGASFSTIRLFATAPFETLEFDEDFLAANLKEGHVKGRRMVRDLIRLGKDMKMVTIGGGIREKADAEFLSSIGCDAAAGSVYTNPLSGTDYCTFVEENLNRHSSARALRLRNNPGITAFDFRDGDSDGTNGKETESVSAQRDEKALQESAVIHGAVRYAKGIADGWGAFYFPGGEVECNLVELPTSLFSNGSYSVSMFVKIEKAADWGSVLYARYLGGFMSLMPNIGSDVSVFRISEDSQVDVWNDIVCRAVANEEWNQLTVTYDSFSETTRYYINGRKAGERLNVPQLIGCRQVYLGGDVFQRSYQGYVSGVIFFDYALSDGEAGDLYNWFRNAPGFCGTVEQYWMDVDQ